MQSRRVAAASTEQITVCILHPEFCITCYCLLPAAYSVRATHASPLPAYCFATIVIFRFGALPTAIRANSLRVVTSMATTELVFSVAM